MSSPGEPKEKRRHRRLSREELELWHQVTRSVARLSRAAAEVALQPAEPAVTPLAPSARELEIAGPALPFYTPPPQSPRPAQPALAPLARRLRKKLARGRSAVDDVIDLHGLRQDEAHFALRGFLAAAQNRGAKVVLVVTGKGLGSRSLGAWPERSGGILHRLVPQWLAAPEFRRIVVGFEEADASHGGAGALYIRIRRIDRPTNRNFAADR